MTQFQIEIFGHISFVRREYATALKNSEGADAPDRINHRKMLEVKNIIFSMFPEIADIVIDFDVRENTEGNEVEYKSTQRN